MPTIHFQTSGKEHTFPEGEETNILRTSIRYEGGVPYKCGGGLCGTCKIHIEEGAEHLTGIKKQEVARLGDKLEQGYRLACQTFMTGDCKVSWDPQTKIEPSQKLKEYWEKG